MITLKFPAINKALQKDLKDLNDDDARRGIIVLNNNAIVLRDGFCLVCDLKDYFTIECGIEDDYELKELDKIMFFMDGNVFSNEFWNELTKGSNMEIKNGSLFVENPKYSKDLHQKSIDIDFIEPLSKLTNLSNQKEDFVSSIAIHFGSLKTIYDCLPSEFKNDHIIFQFTGQDMPVAFTFRNRKHFYGYVKPNYDAAQEGFKFEYLNNYVESITDLLDGLKEDAKSALPPPPPLANITDVPTAEEIPNQLKIVTD